MNKYCIVYRGIYNQWYSYIQKENICELAEYLNNQILKHNEEVLVVYLTDDYDSTFKKKLFFQIEYNIQYFYETYDARLIEQYRLEKLSV